MVVASDYTRYCRDRGGHVMARSKQDLIEILYIAIYVLLATHEIDSAYWNEWQLFHMGGGIQFFLVFNIVLLWVFLYGFRELVARRPSGRGFALAAGATGVITFLIHSFFLVRGEPQFRLPASLAVLVAILLCSLAQLWIMLKDDTSE